MKKSQRVRGETSGDVPILETERSAADIVAEFVSTVGPDAVAQILAPYMPPGPGRNWYSPNGQLVWAIVLSNPGVEFGLDDFSPCYTHYDRTTLRQAVRSLYRVASQDERTRDYLKSNGLKGHLWRMWSELPGDVPDSSVVDNPVIDLEGEDLPRSKPEKLRLTRWGLSAEILDDNIKILLRRKLLTDDPLVATGILAIAERLDGLTLEELVGQLHAVDGDVDNIRAIRVLRAIKAVLGPNADKLVDVTGEDRIRTLKFMGSLALAELTDTNDTNVVADQ